MKHLQGISISFLFIFYLFIFGCNDKTTNSDNGSPQFQGLPIPANNATNQALSVTLSWNCLDPDGDPLAFDVYFGSDSPPPLVSENQSEFSHDISGLTQGNIYYWKIVAKDDNSNSTTSPVWSFSTFDASVCNTDDWGTATLLFENMWNPSITQDGLTMFMEDNLTDRIFVSNKSGNAWSTPIALPAIINDPAFIGSIGSPKITGDGSKLYFVKNDENISYWYSEKTGGNWQTPQPIGIDFTNYYLSDNILISWDGTKFWFTGGNTQTSEEGIFYSQFNGSSWSSLTSLSELNSYDFNYRGMAISADGNSFFFDTNSREDITGSYSLWVSCFIGGQWTEPAPLGSTVNFVNYRERYTPAISYDGSIFYFSAWELDMPGGIFKSLNTQ